MKNIKQDSKYITDSREAILLESTRGSQGVLLLLCVFLVVAVIWSYFSIIQEITVAKGKVIPTGKVKVIQNLEGGIIKAIYVEEGQKVKKGERLMQLDETAVASEYKQEYIKYNAILADNYRLKAQLNNDKRLNIPYEFGMEFPEISRREVELFHTNIKLHHEKIKSLRKSLKLAQHELDIIKPLAKKNIISKVRIIRTEKSINDLQGKIEHAQNEYVQKATEEYSKNKKKLSALNERIKGLKDRLEKTTITAPIDGTVNKLEIVTIGGVIHPGMKIMEIVPYSKILMIEAEIPPDEIGFVKVGQNATVKFNAYDFAIYGGLRATIIHVSSNTITDANNKSHFKVKLKTENKIFHKVKRALDILPGMTVEVDIITGKKSVLNYLLKPLLRTKHSAFREK